MGVYIDLYTLERLIHVAVRGCTVGVSARKSASPVARPRAVKKKCCTVLPRRARWRATLPRGPRTLSKRVPTIRESIGDNMSRSGLEWP